MGSEQRHSTQPTEDTKYNNAGFVGGFILRQYPDTVQIGGGSVLLGRGVTARYYKYLGSAVSNFIVKGCTALDVGCGAGRMTAELAIQGARLAVGIDTSLAMVHISRTIVCSRGDKFVFEFPGSKQTLRRASIDTLGVSNCAFALMDAQALAFPTNSVGFIVCANVLHRVSEPRLVLAELQRILSPGGYLLLSNNFDWQTSFTENSRWLTQHEIIHYFRDWQVLARRDRLPYLAYLYDHKYILSVNQVILFRKPR